MISGFRAFRTSVRDAFAGFDGTVVNVDVLLTWGASTFSVVPVTHEPRRSGRSQYSFRALVRHTFNMLTGFTVFPLQLGAVGALPGGDAAGGGSRRLSHGMLATLGHP
jgi:undecaprenyl-phosphate 4-deoxy-4-formamido-L-arabinose transferase